MLAALDDFTLAIELEEGATRKSLTSKEKNYFYRGEAKRSLGDFVGALADYAVVEKLSPRTIDTATYRFSRGVCLSEMDDLEAGLDDLTTAVELDSGNTAYISRRADVLARLGLFAQAEQALDQGVAIAKKKKDKNLWVMLKKLANSQFVQKNYAAASQQFQVALMSMKANVAKNELHDLHYKRGVCLSHMKRYRSASSCFDEALKVVNQVNGSSALDHKRILILHERAKANQMLKRHQDAIEDFGVVIKMFTGDDRAIFRRGWSYKALGLFLLAAEDFERAKELNPEQKLYQLNYRNIGDIETIILCPAGEERIPSSLRDPFREGQVQIL
jgi:tetratricopeptide (TPR) repeat protein